MPVHRDETGRVFLDYDPTIFIVLLNFFRALSLDGGSGPLRDICVHPSQEKQLLLLVDYLQLQRYIPCRCTVFMHIVYSVRNQETLWRGLTQWKISLTSATFKYML